MDFINNSSYTDYFIIRTDNHNSGANFWIILFNSQSTDNFFVNTTDISGTGFYWFMSNRSNIPTVCYSLSGTSSDNVNISQVSSNLSFGSGSNKYQIRGIYVGSQSVYYNSGSNTPNYNHAFFKLFTEPYVALINDSTTNYISGEFSGFTVVSNLQIEFLSFHLSQDSSSDITNNHIDIVLDDNSPYFLNNLTFPDGGKVYIVPKNVLPNGYLNDSSYSLYLGYQTYDYYVGTTSVINWTTNFSSKAIENDEIREQSQLNQGINNINSFLNDKTYNSSNIVSNMPDSSNYSSPTDDGINSIFTNLYNAFTNTEPVTVRFYIPFTDDKYIDIPSNLVSDKVPSVIVALIQAFYWYIICRYIIKDIATTAQKLKSGEILDSSGDDNIKTDLL